MYDMKNLRLRFFNPKAITLTKIEIYGDKIHHIITFWVFPRIIESSEHQRAIILEVNVIRLLLGTIFLPLVDPTNIQSLTQKLNEESKKANPTLPRPQHSDFSELDGKMKTFRD